MINNFEDIKDHMYEDELKAFCHGQWLNGSLQYRIEKYIPSDRFTEQGSEAVSASCEDHQNDDGPLVQQLFALINREVVTKNDLTTLLNNNLTSPCFAQAVFRPSMSAQEIMAIFDTITLTAGPSTLHLGKSLQKKMDLAFFEELYPEKPFPHWKLPNWKDSGLSPSYLEYFRKHFNEQERSEQADNFYTDLKVIAGQVLRENNLAEKIAYLYDAERLGNNYLQLFQLGIITSQNYAQFDKLFKAIGTARQIFAETSQTFPAEWLAGGREFFKEKCGGPEADLPPMPEDPLTICANDQKLRSVFNRNLNIAKANPHPITVLLGIGNTCITSGQFDVQYLNGTFKVSKSTAAAVVVNDCNCGQNALNLDPAKMEQLIRLITGQNHFSEQLAQGEIQGH